MSRLPERRYKLGLILLLFEMVRLQGKFAAVFSAAPRIALLLLLGSSLWRSSLHVLTGDWFSRSWLCICCYLAIVEGQNRCHVLREGDWKRR